MQRVRIQLFKELANNNFPSVIPAKAGIQRYGLKRSNESGYLPPIRLRAGSSRV